MKVFAKIAILWVLLVVTSKSVGETRYVSEDLGVRAIPVLAPILSSELNDSGDVFSVQILNSSTNNYEYGIYKNQRAYYLNELVALEDIIPISFNNTGDLLVYGKNPNDNLSGVFVKENNGELVSINEQFFCWSLQDNGNFLTHGDHETGNQLDIYLKNYRTGQSYLVGEDLGYDVYLNSQEQVAGAVRKPDQTYQAVSWSKNSGLENLPAPGGWQSRSSGINDLGQVCGQIFRELGNKTEAKAVVWKKSDNNWQMELLPNSDDTLNSWATGLNNRGVSVGLAGQKLHPSLWGLNQDGFEDLNSLIVSGPKIVDKYRVGQVLDINNKNQILVTDPNNYNALLLTPVSSEPLEYQVSAPIDPLQRLGRWNGNEFVPISQNEIQSGDVHVIGHGWAPGYKQALDELGFMLAWDERLTKTDGQGGEVQHASWLADMAQAIQDKNPGSTVLAYSWVDDSATETNLSPFRSARHTKGHGNTLGLALLRAMNVSSVDDIHLVGFSHGAKVTSQAAFYLEELDVNVAQLTLLDSPEWGLVGENNLHSLMKKLSQKNIKTDNYFSWFGDLYTSNINVDLDSGHLAEFGIGDWPPRHNYALDWYISSLGSGAGLDWLFNLPESGLYNQEWLIGGNPDYGKEFNLVLQAPKELPYIVTSPANLSGKTSIGDVLETYSPGGELFSVILTENSPSYWFGNLLTKEGDLAILLSYQFLSAGDGDQLGVWIDDELFLVLDGQYVLPGKFETVLDISDLEPGVHEITLALHSYGDANAQILIENIRTTSIPEPASLIILIAVLFGYSRR